MELIKWLNTNQGAMLTALTLVYVVATIAVVIIMVVSNKLAYSSIQLARQQEDERKRPFVLFDFIFEDSCIFAELRNEGLSSAKNIKVKISPGLTTSQRNDKQCTFITNDLSYLAPSRHAKDFIAVGFHFFEKHTDPIFEVAVTYQDVGGIEYSEIIHHNLAYKMDTISIGKKDIGKELEKIEKEFSKFRRDFTQIKNKLLTNPEEIKKLLENNSDNKNV